MPLCFLLQVFPNSQNLGIHQAAKEPWDHQAQPVIKHHHGNQTKSFLKHLQGLRLHHHPRQHISMSNQPFCEELLPNVQRNPPLVQLKTLSSPPDSLQRRPVSSICCPKFLLSISHRTPLARTAPCQSWNYQTQREDGRGQALIVKRGAW